MRRLILGFLLLLLIGVGAFFAEQREFFAPGPHARSGHVTIVWIKPGERSAQIAQQLQRAGVVRNAALFRVGVQLRGKNAALKAGEYAVPSGASMADVMGILIGAKSISHRLTAAEGLTSAMIFDIVQRNPVLVGNAGTVPPEGSLLPETYLFIRGTTRQQMLSRMAHAQQRLISSVWVKRETDLPLTTPEQAVILASIVEKETAIPEERRHIAAVFLNRLRLGMKLQSDPTIIYGLTKGYPLGRGIRESEITATTPYNTYVVAGLPPTPICNPGKDSLAAVLQPEKSHDLYFVANGSGGHVFTPSIVEHEKNVARWRQVEKKVEQQSGPETRVLATMAHQQAAATPPVPPAKPVARKQSRHKTHSRHLHRHRR
jgi:UPF0755 protein